MSPLYLCKHSEAQTDLQALYVLTDFVIQLVRICFVIHLQNAKPY